MTEIISFALGMIVMALAVIVCAGIVLLTRPATAERYLPRLRAESPKQSETLVSPDDNKPHPVTELAPPSIEQRRREAEMRQRAQEQRTREDLTKVATL